MKLILDEEDTGKNHIIELDSERNPYFLVKPRTYHHAEITDNVALVLVIMPMLHKSQTIGLYSRPQRAV